MLSSMWFNWWVQFNRKCFELHGLLCSMKQNLTSKHCVWVANWRTNINSCLHVEDWWYTCVCMCIYIYVYNVCIYIYIQYMRTVYVYVYMSIRQLICGMLVWPQSDHWGKTLTVSKARVTSGKHPLSFQILPDYLLGQTHEILANLKASKTSSHSQNS
jgi:hypothetical protein